MSQHSSLQLVAAKTYAELKRAVEEAMLRGQRRVDEAKLQTYWQAGRLINEHLVLNRERAAYGARVVPRLSQDLGIDRRTLYQCLQFARFFPIVRTCAHLTWGHYRALCQVADDARRKTLMAQTVKHRWKCQELEERIRPLNAVKVTPAGDGADARPAAKPLVPKRGTVGVCRVVASGDRLALDLGFTSYVDLPAATKLREGQLVWLDAEGAFEQAGEATKADLYTYRAEIIRTVDGDTVWVKIYLEPGRWVKEKLRLRGLDSPEMGTPEGTAAKRFVERLVTQAKAVTIATFKPDKYDRYLADVFFTMDGSDAVFLNNELLANGHAVRKDEYSLTDWDGDNAKLV
jgi:endonuclease YncB( thermonuclease family)